MKRRPAATRDDDLQPLVENADEHGVVAAQRMADHADALGIDVVAGHEQIDGAHVIEDALHRARLVAVVLEIVILRIAEGRIIGGENHIAAPASSAAYGLALRGLDSSRVSLADRRGLVQSQHSGQTLVVRRESGHKGRQPRGRRRRWQMKWFAGARRLRTLRRWCGHPMAVVCRDPATFPWPAAYRQECAAAGSPSPLAFLAVVAHHGRPHRPAIGCGRCTAVLAHRRRKTATRSRVHAHKPQATAR